MAQGDETIRQQNKFDQGDLKVIKKAGFVLGVLLALMACASEPPKPQFATSSNQVLAAPPVDQAQIIFLEPINSVQGLFPIGIFVLDGDKRTQLATTGPHSKAVVLLNPGKHLLMSNQSGMKAHLMEANVEAGKRYYVLVRFIYANGFQLRPLRTKGPSDFSVNSPDFKQWLSSTSIVEMTPESAAFYEKNKEALEKSQAKALESWRLKTPAERAELTLNVDDAVIE